MHRHPPPAERISHRWRRMGARLRSCPTPASVARMAMAGSRNRERGRGELLPGGVAPRRHGSSPAPLPPGKTRLCLRHVGVRGRRSPLVVHGRGGRRQGRAAARRNRLHAQARRARPAPLPPTSQPESLARSIVARGLVTPSGGRLIAAHTRGPSRVTTTTTAPTVPVVRACF